MLAWIERRLAGDQFDCKEHVGEYTRGWTDRADSLLAELRIEIGLAELRACDVEMGGEA